MKIVRVLLLLATLVLFSGCINRHGISLLYYSDCNEYYDLQGYYHNECEDDFMTYKGVKEQGANLFDKDKKSKDLIEGIMLSPPSY